MNVEELYGKLFEEINTLEDSVTFSHQLDDLAASLYKTKQKFEEKVDEHLDNTYKNEFLNLVEACKVDVKTPDSVEKFINEIKAKLKVLPVISMEIAFEPTTSNILHIAEWISFNLKQKVLLDLKINPRLIGGAVVGFNGKMVNASLKRKIEEKYISLEDLKVKK